jgi:hypothetical protein
MKRYVLRRIFAFAAAWVVALVTLTLVGTSASAADEAPPAAHSPS